MLNLFATNRQITSPFGLIGTDENALTYALAYTFQRCPQLLQWFLKQIKIPGIIHSKYHVWWDYQEPSVRPLYLAFRFDGTLKYVARVNRIEHGRTIIDVAPEMGLGKNPVHKTPATIWHFDEPIKLPKPLTTGPGMYNHRTRCDFDLLLTCSTVKEIESTMTIRRNHGT